MLVSTKGRYALRIMIDLAEHQRDGYIPLKETAGRQGISEKYLEGIIKILVKDKMLTGVRGKGGGYKLTKSPDQYTVGSILRLTEGSLAPVSVSYTHLDVYKRQTHNRTHALFSVLLSLFHVLARLLFQNRFSKLCRLLFLLWPLLLLWPYPFHCSAFRSFIFPFGDSLIFAFLYLFSLYSIFLGFISLDFLFLGFISLFFLSLHVFFLHFYTFFIHNLSTIYSFALIIVLINIQTS